MPLIGPGRRMARRRVVAGAAVVRGTAYYAGKKGSEAAQRETEEQAMSEELDAQAQAQAAPEPAPAEAEYTQELEELARLHEQGILTDEEFEAKKKDVLGI